MATIGFAPNVERDSAVALAKSTAGWLEDKGHTTVLLPENAPKGRCLAGRAPSTW